MIIDISQISTLISTVIAVGGIIYGIIKYSENRNLKRQEIILPLMKEFDEFEKSEIAKKILDGYQYAATFKEGWNIEEPSLYYSQSNLNRILQHHGERRITDKGELELRESFGHLLDFFGKLGYLLDINAISKRELGYFLYYIEKIYKDPAIMQFAKNYEYELFAVLLFKLDIQNKEVEELVDSYYKRTKQHYN